MNIQRHILALALMAAAALPQGLAAQKAAPFDPTTATIEENIRYPEVPAKQSAAVASRMNDLAKDLREAGYSVTMLRSGEVVMVTIPCSALFSPNESVLSTKASSKLAPLKNYIKRREDYKVVLAVHSDDTGDETYADRLTADRANSIDEYFFKEDSHRETGIIPYGICADEPVADNHGRANRAKNRRVEFYFIPTQEYIKKK